MKTQKFDNEESWLEARRGKITGTKLGNLVKRDGKPKIGYYELIAERVALPPSDENRMDRGHRLEEIAIDRFVAETGKKVNKDLVIMYRDDNEDIAYSPDGFIGKTEDVEVKCLSSARHIEALLTKHVPSEYMEQIIQGFVVNDKLKIRHVVFYDPRMPIDYFVIEVARKDVKDDIEFYLSLERRLLEEIKQIENQLTF